MKRVLLTGARAPVALELARRFHTAGLEVFLCDSFRFACAGFTRCKKRYFKVPSPNRSSHGFVDALNKIIDKEKIDLLIPTCEEVFRIAAAKSNINCAVFVDSLEKLSRLHNKWTFFQSVKDSKVQVPESIEITSEKDLNRFSSELSDFVFKPVYSRFASQTLIRPTPKQLKSIAATEETPWIAQRFIRGKEYSTYSVAHSGKLTASCTYRSSFRTGIGTGISFQVTPVPVIAQFISRFIQQNNFTGQIGFDFIIDSDDKVWVLECNPRATSGVHLFETNDPLVNAIVRPDAESFESSASQSQMIGPALACFGWLQAFRQRRVGQLFKELVTGKDVLFRWNDPLPFLASPYSMLELIWTAMRNRQAIHKAATLDTEWNGEPI